MEKELEFYNKIKNWDFTDIKMYEENFTDWDMYKILNECTFVLILKQTIILT